MQGAVLYNIQKKIKENLLYFLLDVVHAHISAHTYTILFKCDINLMVFFS